MALQSQKALAAGSPLLTIPRLSYLKSNMTLTVIIPTYNGAHKILHALRSLEQQEQKPDEVIVVVDGSTDGTADLLRKTSFTLNNFKLIEQENGGRAQVRNKGGAEAKGELLLFLDDDMIASENWVKAHVLHHTLYKDTLLTGREEIGNDIVGSDFKKFRFWLNQKWNVIESASTPQEASWLLEKIYITASNFSLPRDLFFKLGGFDERLNDAEDYDLAVRAKRQGFALYWNQDALAYNNDVENVTCLKLILRHRQYAKAHEQLRKFKPEIYEGTDARAPYEPDIVRKTVFKSLCSRWWVNSVDKEYWKWMPEKARFKLYDMIITANGALYPDKVKLS